jgi:hypothetical protein
MLSKPTFSTIRCFETIHNWWFIQITAECSSETYCTETGQSIDQSIVW